MAGLVKSMPSSEPGALYNISVIGQDQEVFNDDCRDRKDSTLCCKAGEELGIQIECHDGLDVGALEDLCEP